MGYKTVITKGTGDGGVDLILKQDNKTIVVQCKAHKHSVGPEPVRALWGVKDDFCADEAIFIAYSGVTTGARDFAKGKKIQLLNVDDLIRISLEAENFQKNVRKK